MKNRFSLLMVMLAMSLTVILTSNTTASAATNYGEKSYANATDLDNGKVPVPDIPNQGNIGIYNLGSDLGECNTSPGLGQVDAMVLISDPARSCEGQINYYICNDFETTTSPGSAGNTATSAWPAKLACWTHSSPISARSCAWKVIS